MNYTEAYGYMMNAAREGIRPGLSRIRELAARLGNPQEDLKIIHVAGTNGKGSVCTFLEYIFRCSGYSTARYISPSLFDYRERFQFNGSYITEEELASVVTEVSLAAADMDDTPTAFELETAAAFLFAKIKKCDVMILETGMGGLYDATNIIKAPLATVFVSIGMDHMQYLGDDIRDIAAEKAGIIKEGVPVVTVWQEPEVTEILRSTAAEKNAPVRTVDTDSLSGIISADTENWTESFEYRGERYSLGLAGTYQLINAAAALETTWLLRDNGSFCITDDAIKEGLETARWPGRFDRLCSDPPVVVDGAHNPHGAKALRETAGIFLNHRRIIPVMGVFKDKDYNGILDEMAGISDDIVVYRAPGNRGLDEAVLKQAAEKRFRAAYAFKDIRAALRQALLMPGLNKAVLVFGTLSTIKDAADFLKEYGTADII